VALCLLFVGFIVSPELLIYLGPMRDNLTSDIELVRNTALTELMLYRVISLFLFALFLGIILMWNKIIQHRFIVHITKHSSIESPRRRTETSHFNASLLVILIVMLIGLLYVAFGTELFPPSTREFINREDGFIEQSTALIFLLCSILSAGMAFKHPGNRKTTIVYVLFSAFFFLMFGEEISWGQRIFNLETIAVLKDINVQGENNIHNIFGSVVERLFFACVFIYCVILPLLKLSHPFWGQLFDIVGLPLPSTGLALGFLAISLLHNWTVYRVLSSGVGLRIPELREVLTSLGFLLFMYECWLMTGERKLLSTKLADSSV
jgi:hypothetical protein